MKLHSVALLLLTTVSNSIVNAKEWRACTCVHRSTTVTAATLEGVKTVCKKMAEEDNRLEYGEFRHRSELAVWWHDIVRPWLPWPSAGGQADQQGKPTVNTFVKQQKVRGEKWPWCTTDLANGGLDDEAFKRICRDDLGYHGCCATVRLFSVDDNCPEYLGRKGRGVV